MIVYFNYPRSRISIHRSNDCPHIQKQSKTDQRYIHITIDSCVETLRILETTPFTSTADSNDIWVDISFPTSKQEMSIVYIVQALFGKKYSPFREATIEEHNCQ